MKLINKTKGTVLANDVILARTFFTRIKGLLGKKDFPQGEALVLEPCNSIHTFFLRFAIDVIFVDSDNKIISARSYRPWRMSPIFSRAKFALELPSGVILASLTNEGDEISFVS